MSGGTVWAGAVGILRAAGYYCPLVIDSPGGQGYEDIVNYGPAIVQSDPLKSIIFSYHLYANTDNNNNQAQFESGILTPLNTLRINSGAAIIVDEIGIYVKDQGGNGAANGGDQTAFPSGTATAILRINMECRIFIGFSTPSARSQILTEEIFRACVTTIPQAKAVRQTRAIRVRLRRLASIRFSIQSAAASRISQDTQRASSDQCGAQAESGGESHS